jgi:hypothetical protein
MIPTPEPAGDIKAQLAAMLDPAHPKRACFLVPEDMTQIPHKLSAIVVARAEGVLVTQDQACADAFSSASNQPDSFDRTMAEILGYPEAKPDVVAACNGQPFTRARAVQARDKDGHVITEACCSPGRLEETQNALQAHVPTGGTLVAVMPLEALARRILLREAGA